jgi:hypothetical protein
MLAFWIDVFYKLFIPLIGGLSLTGAKLIADGKLVSWDETNDIALDMVLLAVGALGAFFISGGTGEQVLDGGIGDVFLGVILLYLRYESRINATTSVTPKMGIAQLALGFAALFWTVKAF